MAGSHFLLCPLSYPSFPTALCLWPPQGGGRKRGCGKGLWKDSLQLRSKHWLSCAVLLGTSGLL